MGFLLFAVCLASWAWCGYLAYGYTLGYFQREYARINTRDSFADLKFTAWVMAIGGPIGLLVVSKRHGRVYDYIDAPEKLFDHLRSK